MTSNPHSSQPFGSNQRRFGHDLLLIAKDQQYARSKWPNISDELVSEELIDLFKLPEKSSRLFKSLTHWAGTAAILLAIVALIDLCVAMLPPGTLPPGYQVSTITSAAAILSLVVAFVASRYGPLRRTWLFHRFKCEILRQWHFRKLLAAHSVATQGSFSNVDFSSLKNSFETNVIRQEMDRLIEQGHNVLGGLPSSVKSAGGASLDEFLDAYFDLRVRHQAEFFQWKTGVDGNAFAGLSNRLIIRLVDVIAAFSLITSLVLGAIGIFTQLEWSGEVSVLLLIIGVAIRAWADGLGVRQEHELYGDMRNRFARFEDKWRSTTDHIERLNVALELEQAASEELRSFLRIHEPAIFIL